MRSYIIRAELSCALKTSSFGSWPRVPVINGKFIIFIFFLPFRDRCPWMGLICFWPLAYLAASEVTFPDEYCHPLGRAISDLVAVSWFAYGTRCVIRSEGSVIADGDLHIISLWGLICTLSPDRRQGHEVAETIPESAFLRSMLLWRLAAFEIEVGNRVVARIVDICSHKEKIL